MTEQPRNLSIGSNLKIGLFHLGSGMADIIATGIWNRVMISDLGFNATPIGLLVALRYFLAPVGIWVGRISDRRAIFGYQRLFWVWLGRLMMAFSIAALGMTTASLLRGADRNDPMIWVVMVISLLLFSLGTAISGGTFLALIYDRASTSQRGRAVGIVWTFLLVGFTVGGILFGVMLPEDANDGVTGLAYSPETLQNLFLYAALILAFIWFISLVGEERRRKSGPIVQEETATSKPSSMLHDLSLAWNNRQTRFFFWYLALSMLFAFSQDLILEPFAADVFEMPVRVTTRFSAYWGSMSILGTIAFLFLGRRYKSLTNTKMSYIGVAILILTFGLLAFSSFADIRGLVTPALITLGLGLGFWNVGTLGLMMDMSPFGQAGTFLGFWTLVVTLARGAGVSGGGILRDLFLSTPFGANDHGIAYGLVFLIGTIGLVVTFWALTQIKLTVKEETKDAEQVFVGALD